MRTQTPTAVGMLLKARRIAAGLEPAYIAKRIKVSERTVWRCEANGILPRNKFAAAALLALLNLTPADIARAKNKQPRKTK